MTAEKEKLADARPNSRLSNVESYTLLSPLSLSSSPLPRVEESRNQPPRERGDSKIEIVPTDIYIYIYSVSVCTVRSHSIRSDDFC